uniref:Rieske-like [2Fe-2S] domain-containing protein n=1 Tax=Cryptomonas curvata TaxID=233186 RepID=A0A7S0M5F2_9CRYP|mmetsp:Transcript_24879/g.52001  ORF Transcript_24879/g.52001 Transcript_24879/m.52001 type:complete len:198 (+) Transcript_24879:39-632(+)
MLRSTLFVCAISAASAFAPTGFSPALRTSFKGDALCTKAAGRMTGPVAKAEAWVRVVPANSVAPGKQSDALVAGTPVLTGRYSNGKVWAIGAKNSATGTEMFGGKVDEAAQTLTDPQWGTKYSLVNGDVVGKWCPSPPIIGSLIGALFPPQGVWVPEVRESNGYIEVKLDVDAKAEFEKKFWKGILDAQGKADGGYY